MERGLDKLTGNELLKKRKEYIEFLGKNIEDADSSNVFISDRWHGFEHNLSMIYCILNLRSNMTDKEYNETVPKSD